MADYNETYLLSAQTITKHSDADVTDIFVRLERIMMEIETALTLYSPLFDSVTDEMLRRGLIEKKAPVAGGQSTTRRKQP